MKSERLIKFRAWNTEIKTMGSAFPLDVILGDVAERPEAWHRDKNNIIIMQYTGLKDKNGVEIYEGDICCNLYGRKYGVELQPSNIGFVLFENGKFSVVKKEKYTERTKEGDPLPTEVLEWKMNLNDKNIEVIGNIYQNPDLL